LTLASCLFAILKLTPLARKKLSLGDEGRLSAWIRSHLSVCVFPYADRDALANLERIVLGKLDPPVNLDGMRPTPIRMRLTAIREILTGNGYKGVRNSN
jgi:hypothetical protein